MFYSLKFSCSIYFIYNVESYTLKNIILSRMNKIKYLIKNSPWLIAAIYVVIGFLWIQFSDQWVLNIFDDPETITAIQSQKGWGFVFVSGLIIFLLIKVSNNLLGEVIDDLTRSNKKFKATIENAPVGIAHHKPDENWMEVNKTLCDLLGYSREELMKLHFPDFIHPDDIDKGREMDSKLINGETERFTLEKRYIRKDGSQFFGKVHKSAVNNGTDTSTYLVVVLEDITHQKEQEEILQKSLKEKELLLSEIHHRVRNNLALISAFFDLESMHNESPDLEYIFKKHKARIKCLALIHTTFSHNLGSANIKFDSLLIELTDYVHFEFLDGHGDSEIRQNTAPVSLNINLAIPACLIVTEILINTSAGNSTDIDHPLFDISLEQESDNITVSLCDNGHKLLKKEIFEGTDNLSYTIIDSLLSKIEGSLDTTFNENEQSISFTFKKEKVRGPGSSIV